MVTKIRSPDGNHHVQMAVLGALRNLSYGRVNVENKRLIAGDTGLPELSFVLKTTGHPEVCMYTYVLHVMLVDYIIKKTILAKLREIHLSINSFIS